MPKFVNMKIHGVSPSISHKFISLFNRKNRVGEDVNAKIHFAEAKKGRQNKNKKQNIILFSLRSFIQNASVVVWLTNQDAVTLRNRILTQTLPNGNGEDANPSVHIKSAAGEQKYGAIHRASVYT